MWLFTPLGFYSVVQKHGDKSLCVRARVSADLDNLRDLVPELGKTIHTPLGDYHYRAYVEAEALGRGLAKFVESINYDNFKNEVKQRQGIRRAEIYGYVWADVMELQRQPVPRDSRQVSFLDGADENF